MVRHEDDIAPNTQIEVPVGMLSKREAEVFALIIEGCTNKGIAEHLFISENTARNHVSHILRKLGVNRRVQVAAFRLQAELSGSS